MQTQVPVGSPLARKLFSVGLFTQWQQSAGFGRNLRGAMPTQSAAESKIKMQSPPGMPVVMATDLTKTAGDNVSIDCFDIIGGKPLVGDVNAEGKGEKLTSTSMDVRIDLLTKVVDAGGKMAQKRTLHALRGIARSQLVGYYAKLDSQSTLVHMAGARGTQVSRDWLIPTAADVDFAGILINTVKAPTYNRHFVADNGATKEIVQGGVNLDDIDSGDVLSLEHFDILRAMLDDMVYPLHPVKIPDDPASADEPLWVMYVTARQWNSILVNTTGLVWRTFLQNAYQRKTQGSKHPLFSGETGMWNGILVKRLDRFSIRHLPGDSYQYISAANRYTAAESVGTVNAALTPGYAVDRALLLGAQGLAFALGINEGSQYFFSWLERKYNFERNLEVAGDCMHGKAKIRFGYPDEAGNVEPTDHGVIAFDTAVKL